MLPDVPAYAEAGPSTVCLCSHTHIQDKLALRELCSGEAAYFKPPGNEIVPARANAPIPSVSVR